MNKTIQEMPKVVLHLHLDGSLRPETVQEWLQEVLEKKINIEQVQQMLMVDKDCRDLNQYLEKFDLPMKVLQTTEHLQRATYELYEDLAKQNVKYAEVRFAPSKHLMNGLSYDEVVQATVDGMNKAKENFDIDGNLILCLMRGEENPEAHMKTVETAQKFLGKGVCAVDLAGAEALFKTDMYAEIFKIAKEKGIPFTIHAGEADGPESIRAALRFGAKRIGHGVRCIEDEGLINELIREGIVLEICPISNLQTQAVIGKHPVEDLYRKGIATTLSTDNNTVSNTNILEEYEYVLNNTKLQADDLIQINLNAANGIFGTMQQKTKLIQTITSYENRQKSREEIR